MWACRSSWIGTGGITGFEGGNPKGVALDSRQCKPADLRRQEWVCKPRRGGIRQSRVQTREKGVLTRQKTPTGWHLLAAGANPWNGRLDNYLKPQRGDIDVPEAMRGRLVLVVDSHPRP